MTTPTPYQLARIDAAEKVIGKYTGWEESAVELAILVLQAIDSIPIPDALPGDSAGWNQACHSVGCAEDYFSINNGNLIILVNKDDYERLGFPRLNINLAPRKKPYVRVWVNGRNQYLHRLILDAPKDMIVDHINGNTVDNRKSNLRLATTYQNAANAKIRIGTSKYKGVHWSKNERKWVAGIKNSVHLGYFDNEDIAAQAYNKAAIELFGDFAKLNIIGDRDGK